MKKYIFICLMIMISTACFYIQTGNPSGFDAQFSEIINEYTTNLNTVLTDIPQFKKLQQKSKITTSSESEFNSIVEIVKTVRSAPTFLNDIASSLKYIDGSIQSDKKITLSDSQKAQFENLIKLFETVKQEVAKLGDIEKNVTDIIKKIQGSRK